LVSVNGTIDKSNDRVEWISNINENDIVNEKIFASIDARDSDFSSFGWNVETNLDIFVDVSVVALGISWVADDIPSNEHVCVVFSGPNVLKIALKKNSLSE